MQSSQTGDPRAIVVHGDLSPGDSLKCTCRKGKLKCSNLCGCSTYNCWNSAELITAESSDDDED